MDPRRAALVAALGMLGFACALMLCVLLLGFLPGAQTTPVPTDTLEPSPDSGISPPFLMASEGNQLNFVVASDGSQRSTLPTPVIASDRRERGDPQLDSQRLPGYTRNAKFS